MCDSIYIYYHEIKLAKAVDLQSPRNEETSGRIFKTEPWSAAYDFYFKLMCINDSIFFLQIYKLHNRVILLNKNISILKVVFTNMGFDESNTNLLTKERSTYRPAFSKCPVFSLDEQCLA